MRSLAKDSKSIGLSLLGVEIGILPSPHGVSIGFFGSTSSNRTVEDDDSPFEFSAVLIEVFYFFPRRTPATRPRTGLCAGRPTRCCQIQCMRRRRNDAPGRRLGGVQLLAIVQSSRCAFARPACLNCSSVQWLASSSCFDPVSRGPMRSVRYVRLALSSS